MTLEKQIAEDYGMVLKEAQSMGCNKINALYNISLDNMKAIVNALEEVQKYREIGTQDECRAAMEIAKNQGNTRTNNDVIAEYVKERYPGLIKNTDYKLYSFSMKLKSLRDNLKKEIKKIDFSQLPKAFDHLEEKK